MDSGGFWGAGCLAQRRPPTAASFAGGRSPPAGVSSAKSSSSSCTARWTSSPRLTSSPLATGAIEKGEYATPERVRRRRMAMGWPGPLLLWSSISALGARLTRVLTWGGGDAWPHVPKASCVSGRAERAKDASQAASAARFFIQSQGLMSPDEARRGRAWERQGGGSRCETRLPFGSNLSAGVHGAS